MNVVMILLNFEEKTNVRFFWVLVIIFILSKENDDSWSADSAM